MELGGIEPQALCHDEPVQVSTQGQTDGRPAGLGHAAEQGQTGHAHQQVGAHVRSLGAHGGDNGAQLAAAQVEVLGVVVLGVQDADGKHTRQIDHNGNENADG